MTGKKNVLIIIGNGFDLELGLKTGYTDFFEWLKKKVDAESLWGCHKSTTFPARNDEKMSNVSSIKVTDWWSWHFINGNVEKGSWAEVEKEIHSILEKIADNGFREKNIFTPKAQFIMPLKIDSAKCRSVGGEDKISLADKLRMDNQLYCDDINEVNKWLLEELKKFEKLFMEYLLTQTTDSYCKLAQGLVEKFLRFLSASEFDFLDVSTKSNIDSEAQGLQKEYQITNIDKCIHCVVSKRYSCYLLNFNYTEFECPQPSYTFGGEEADNGLYQTNVHGSIYSEEIIMGIDETAKVPDGLEIFKKTHRKLFLKQDKFSLPAEMDYILVYGHSLDHADYSYFQSMFDLYDIYHGKTIMYFLINDAKEDISNKTDKIYKLYHTYGEEVLGDARGKNLLHKLLLENRIQIVLTSTINEW